MTKRYKLLKDLPGVPAGSEWVEEQAERRLAHYFTNNPYPEMTISTACCLEFEFSKWFQEIPDYSFVRDGDVYEYGDSMAIIWRGRKYDRPSAWSKEEYVRGMEGWVSRSFEDKYLCRLSLKNLVYRPGKNPWDTPEVDKLGWGPMEKQPKLKIFEIEEGDQTHGCIVHEVDKYGRIWRGQFTKREDAELFKQALGGSK